MPKCGRAQCDAWQKFLGGLGAALGGFGGGGADAPGAETAALRLAASVLSAAVPASPVQVGELCLCLVRHMLLAHRETRVPASASRGCVWAHACGGARTPGITRPAAWRAQRWN